MPSIQYNKGGFGVKKTNKEKWYRGEPIKNVDGFVKEYTKKLDSLSSISKLETKTTEIINGIGKKDKKLKHKLVALRIAALRQADELGNDAIVENFDNKFEATLKEYTEKHGITMNIVGLKKRERPDDEILEDEEIGESDAKKPKTDDEPIEKEIEKSDESIEKEIEKSSTDETDTETSSKKRERSDDEILEDEEIGEIDAKKPKTDDETDIEQETQIDDQKEQPPKELPEIKLTHPDDILEKEAVQVDDNVQEVPSDQPVLPDDVVPEGQLNDDDGALQETIIPQTFNENAINEIQKGQGGGEEEEEELPTYEEMMEGFVDSPDADPRAISGFDNSKQPIRIEYDISPSEIQDLIIVATKSLIKSVIPDDVSETLIVEQVLDDIINQSSDDPGMQVDETETDDSSSSSVQAQPTETQLEEMEIEKEMTLETLDEPDEPDVPDVEMKEPSKQMLKEQERAMKNQQRKDENERKQREKKEKAMNDLHSQLFSREQQPEPMMTDEYESKMKKKIPYSQRIFQYIANNVVSSISELVDQKQKFISQIKNGDVRSELDSTSTRKTPTKFQKEIKLSIAQQEIKDLYRAAINNRLLLRSADITAEVADYTAKNLDRIKQKLDPNNAISKYIYPSYRDPDTFNIVKYKTDANGNVVINRQTGQPIIESISAVQRDDTRKLLEQKQAVDATDTPTPYYPKYGKQARRYFSKLEYNYLGRMFQGPGGPHRASLPKPTRMLEKVQTMLNEMGDSLEISDKSIDRKNLFKQWVELEVLKNSYQRYNQYSDYQYVQDKKELGQDGTLVDPDAMESAGILLQNITTQKLLDLLSSQKQQELNVEKQKGESQMQDLIDKQNKMESRNTEMDTSISPEQAGAQLPQNPTDQQNTQPSTDNPEEEQKLDLSSWAKKGESTYNPSYPTAYRRGGLPAFGGIDGMQVDGDGGVWV